MTRPPAGARPGDDEVARLAAAAAGAVPGLIRLQPGLRHLAGRAARALFTGAGGHDDEGDLNGIVVDREPDLHVTLRAVVAQVPPPRQTAAQLQAAVGRVLADATGAPVAVTVVVVDIEPTVR